MYRAASGTFLVYPSSYAGTNQATGISFQIPADAFDAEVDALRTKGVSLQTFDVPVGTWNDGVLEHEAPRPPGSPTRTGTSSTSRRGGSERPVSRCPSPSRRARSRTRRR